MVNFSFDQKLNRRQFAATASVASAGLLATQGLAIPIRAEESKSRRPLIGCIGVGGQGHYIGKRAMAHGDIVAVCDVQRQHAERANQQLGAGKAEIFEDYRRLLDRKDIEAVLIATPDHWHTAPAIAALQAGKHVYCEKPLTLTIEEGQRLVRATKESGKTLQCGNLQRTDMLQFARAVATARSGQLGRIKQVNVILPGPAKSGGPFDNKPVPEGLNWDLWLGQAPAVEFCPERCHSTFRWWYEYSGGIMTDWGAHSVDIAHWALDIEDSGPLTIDGSKTELPKIPNGYNTPPSPIVEMQYPNDVKVMITSGGDHGVMIVGEAGRIFVDRGKLTGKPIEMQDADDSLKKPVMELVTKLFKGNIAKQGDHMGNFFEAFMYGKHPISEVVGQHRVASACHLANISIRLGRKLAWDASHEKFVGDAEANQMLKREPRQGYEFAT